MTGGASLMHGGATMLCLVVLLMPGGFLLCRMQILVPGGALGFGCFSWICVHVMVTCGCVGWMFVGWLFVDVFEAVFGAVLVGFWMCLLLMCV